ncbi:hypothetical protein PHLGIDRAFT_267793 [Phlebiopsis gigantea 11061_1 CR5-6]|uniref:Palmitoyltransferase n=1 Tax=Phlebiopsis gigantea (strain 11061_1 CR5-6) TaxID=745531 RepID=A0A0C3PCW7_PHLG1|nr:hypothetical protein PHLGIDRAFT_267793 [Phlebiopsis gigantea 11061_1 CR5-6]
MAQHDTHPQSQSQSSDARCCGVVQEATSKSLDRRNKRREKPQPWIVLKMTIGFALGIIAYASYVYIGRFCVPMLKSKGGSLGGRQVGVPFLVIFCILLIMMLWAYALVVLTSPGYARDYVERSPPPQVALRPVPRWWDSSSDLEGGQYEYTSNSTHANGGAQTNGSSTLQSLPVPHEKPIQQQQQDDNSGVADAIRPVQVARAHAETDDNGALPPSSDDGARGLPMMFTRKLPMTPIMRPEYRYCNKDGFVKPLRAHHCRACGTCILKYDHHCPWIGQCVGARNHKFFVNFLQWAGVFCMWTFATLVAGVVQESRNGNLDPQYIVIIALAGLFILFTVSLLFTHVRLILLNQSTVESLNMQRMKEREKSVLARHYAWYQFGAKRQLRKQWDREWGDIDTEANLWWLGNTRENWVSVMGHNVWQWFLPIGSSPSDGRHWLPNPRFDSEGKPRPRSLWPVALQ